MLYSSGCKGKLHHAWKRAHSHSELHQPILTPGERSTDCSRRRAAPGQGSLQVRSLCCLSMYVLIVWCRQSDWCTCLNVQTKECHCTVHNGTVCDFGRNAGLLHFFCSAKCVQCLFRCGYWSIKCSIAVKNFRALKGHLIVWLRCTYLNLTKCIYHILSRDTLTQMSQKPLLFILNLF